jgi:hypothetical protein
VDYQAIDRFMKQTGLDKEPAFDFLHFLSEDIPPMEKKRILGLYFPDGDPSNHAFGYLPASTIVLPLDSDVDTLLHELGHRYGDYYYGNLSESFAEDYRKHAKKIYSYATRIDMRNFPPECIGCKSYKKLCPYCDLGGWNHRN